MERGEKVSLVCSASYDVWFTVSVQRIAALVLWCWSELQNGSLSYCLNMEADRLTVCVNFHKVYKAQGPIV